MVETKKAVESMIVRCQSDQGYLSLTEGDIFTVSPALAIISGDREAVLCRVFNRLSGLPATHPGLTGTLNTHAENLPQSSIRGENRFYL